MASVTGRTVDRILRGYVEQAGAPVVSVAMRCAGRRTELTLAQQRFVGTSLPPPPPAPPGGYPPPRAPPAPRRAPPRAPPPAGRPWSASACWATSGGWCAPAAT